MPVHRISYLLLVFLIFSVAPPCNAQAVPAEQAPKPDQQPECAGFSGWVKKSHWGGAWEAQAGCLTLGNASVHVDPPPVDFQITELASIERKRFIAMNGFQFKLKNGKKVEFYVMRNKGSGVDDAATIEKAIRDMAAQQGVVLK
jgi:hypothetical protein